MENLNDLKKIWHTANTDGLPNSDEIVRMAKKFRNQKLIKKVALIVTALILNAFMILVIFSYKSTMVTTWLGEGCILLAGSILIYTNINSIGRFYRFKDYANKEFIKFLEQTRLNQVYFYKKTQAIALAIGSAGLLLYPFESVYKGKTFFIATYTFLALYIAVLWLVIRPRTYKKGRKKLEETIEKMDRLTKQL